MNACRTVINGSLAALQKRFLVYLTGVSKSSYTFMVIGCID